MTIRPVAEDWLAYTANDTVDSTVEGYERIIRNHLNPVFGDRPVSDINQKEVQSVVNGWNADHAPQTVRNRVNVLIPIPCHGDNEITVGKRNGGVSLPKHRGSILIVATPDGRVPTTLSGAVPNGLALPLPPCWTGALFG